MKKYKICSLFSGAGGFDLGFLRTGRCEVVFANDFDRFAVDTYRANIGGHIVHGDIKKVESLSIPDFDILIGGFPCQGFSIANPARGKGEDVRNSLYLEMLRILKDKKPLAFLAENVEGIMTLEKGAIFERILADFDFEGYDTDSHLVNACDFGVPQKRKRVIICGVRKDMKSKEKETFISRIQILSPWVQSQWTREAWEAVHSTSHAIRFLENIPLQEGAFLVDGVLVQGHIAPLITGDTYVARKHKVDMSEVSVYLTNARLTTGVSIRSLSILMGKEVGKWFQKGGSAPKPEDWLELKFFLGFDDTYDAVMLEFVRKKIVPFNSADRRASWASPSWTITGLPLIHPNGLRRLSVLESAILQSFPKNYIFCGSRTRQYMQVGNAVPPLLAVHLATQLVEVLDSLTGVVK